MTTTTTVTLTEELHDMVDETSLWHVLHALEEVCLDMAGPNPERNRDPTQIAQGLSELQHIAFAYRL